uniref:phosphatidylinositol N-acetylglucosaminyltransferase subunit C-like n=1 Tax=Styela clava TaxID=7725 RepID=UPI0019396FC1|nr:phosphatidylinositol N-acetylglucosaminyltransferase subunit C-like [Styela clava]
MTTNRKKWRKVLYEVQNVPDNYVDESFLTEMRKNIYIRKYEYWDLVRRIEVITQQLCTVSCLIVSWWLLDEGLYTPYTMLKWLMPVSVIGFCVYLYLTTSQGERWKALFSNAKTAVVVLCLTDFLSPILKTLTHTISTDTIYAMSVLMILGHLLFHDYGSDAAPISRAVSLNMSLFSSVCLASRLDSSEHVFAIVILALFLFGFWPMLQRTLRRETPWFMDPFTVLLSIATFLLLLFIHLYISLLFLLLIVFVNIICPLLLMSLQIHKNNIYGPWDEAVIDPDSPRIFKEKKSFKKE